jgi:hypothetical protein
MDQQNPEIAHALIVVARVIPARLEIATTRGKNLRFARVGSPVRRHLKSVVIGSRKRC